MSAAVKADPALIGGVQLALDALAESAEPGSVGDHLGATMVAERLALHSFACTASAYPGWVWTVSLARAPRSKTVTVCETALLPGADALQAPAWLPYADRLAPGDVGPGDVTPYVEDDPLLVAGGHGEGRSVAFMSDCGPHWAPPPFVDWTGYAALWNGIAEWAGGHR